MPKNLNALIRYKTLDKCLSNPHRKWKINDLVEACSEALRESRGNHSGVSERTIRDDIRVMRSDILGFNAPIKQKSGDYHYSDPTYSIFGVSVEGRHLLERILEFIFEIREEVEHPQMKEIIKKLQEALQMEHIEEEVDKYLDSFKSSEIQVGTVNEKHLLMDLEEPEADDKMLEPGKAGFKSESSYLFRWSEIFMVL